MYNNNNNNNNKIINKIIKGGRYDCHPTNEYNNICIDNENGKYKSKESCINDCENLYIYDQLKKANLINETVKFYKFIKDIIKNENISVYIKGGNVIGLKILKMIYDKYSNDDEKFKKYFNKFLELELIKDWDFSAYTNNEIDKTYREKLNKIAKKYNLVSRASTFILYQTQKPILTDNKALFEISILKEEEHNYSDMEIPLTTMKIKVTEFNIKYIFMFAKEFLSKEYNFDIIKRMISKISVIINPSENGFYSDTIFDDGNFNKNLLEFINNYKKINKNIPQFLVTHLKDPFRLLYRLPEKNIPKTIKIQKFIDDTFGKTNINWLFDSNFMIKFLNDFTKDFGDYINNIYKKNNNIDDVVKFMEGIKWNRVKIEYTKLLTDNSKKLLNNMLGSDIINKIIEINKKN